MKYLGVDWGMKKIGLAVSEGALSTPLRSIEIHGLKDGAEKVARIVSQEKIDLVVIGQPEGDMGKKVQKAAEAIKELGVEVEVADETLSTQRAARSMLEMGYNRKSRQREDAVAAALILQQYLDEKK